MQNLICEGVLEIRRGHMYAICYSFNPVVSPLLRDSLKKYLKIQGVGRPKNAYLE